MHPYFSMRLGTLIKNLYNSLMAAWDSADTIYVRPAIKENLIATTRIAVTNAKLISESIRLITISTTGPLG